MKLRLAVLSIPALVFAAHSGSQALAQPPRGPAGDTITRAICVLSPVGDGRAAGTITFTQEGDHVHVSARLRGLAPGNHGFHVHQFGDLSSMNDGESAGGHFDPHHRNHHGRPDDKERHAGDLGNIHANGRGIAVLDVDDHAIKLNGPHTILGRSIIVHAGEDKFTQPSGNAGGRVAIGVIGVANPKTRPNR